MKNLILQHRSGDIDELSSLSIENIRAYAKLIGADYQFLDGTPFHVRLTPPCQKVAILCKDWDDYDNVLMLDPDVFVVKGMTRNVFEEVGNGIHGPTQMRLKRRLIQANRMKPTGPYWAGSIYKFNKFERTKLLLEMPTNDKWLDFYNKAYHFEDEGILAELASRAEFTEHNRYLDFKWNQCSFLPKPEQAFMLHIRTKKPGILNGTWENGGKRPKIENYRELIEKGII